MGSHKAAQVHQVELIKEFSRINKMLIVHNNSTHV